MENAGVGKEGDEEHIWILPPYPGEKYWFPFDILNGPHRQSQLMLEADIDSVQSVIYRGAGKSLARPTWRCILFDGENISFDASLVIYINSTNIPPIMIINRIYENQNLLSP